MSKKEAKNTLKDKEFAKKEANIVFDAEKNVKKPQKVKTNDEVLGDNSIVDKKLVTSILKQEKKELKKAKRLEKEIAKQKKIKRRKKISELLKAKKEEEKKARKTQEEALKDFEKKGRFASWFRLDNAGSIYPSAIQKNWNFVYRISANMKDRIKTDVLQSALDDIMPRFPSFNVKLKHGFFWNYFEPNFKRLEIEKETTFPCMPFNLSDGESFLIRVLYSEYDIILEVFHGISDGRGALFFFNSLVARYIERLGATISEYIGCSSYLDIPSDEEIEDSFFAKATNEKLKRPKEKPAYKIKGNVMPAGMVNSVIGEMSVSKIKEVAKSYNASISAFLASVIGYSIYKKCKNEKKAPRISIPVDLRPRFDSKTLRNFSSYKNIEVSGDDLTFEQVIDIFKTEFAQMDNKFFQSNINSNVNLQKNFFIKILPLFIKNIALKTSFNYLGENYQTLAFSNIGKVEVPKEFEDYVEGYTVNLGRSLHNAKSIGVVSYKDTLSMCISSKIYETETERDIFRMLVKLGVPVKIYSNRRDLYGAR
ncbi:MAG: hypothetical protein IKC11_06330 [Clostridia bacterium]|nr:hypothetical protein [Clostridia bacterium]